MKRFSFFIAMVVLTFFGQILSASSVEETFKKTLNAEGKSGLRLDNVNGGIEVSAWDKDFVQIIAYKRTHADSWDKAKELMEDLEIRINESGSEIEVETILPHRKNSGGGFLKRLFSGGSSGASVEYEVRVPQKFNLDISSTNGSLDIKDCNGAILLHTTNGKIFADNIGGTLSCRSTNGGIKAFMSSVSDNRDMDFKTTNGSIRLYLPLDVRADLEAHTTNGSINCELPLDRKKRPSKRHLYGSINEGGPQIYLKTTNGSINILEN